MFQKLHPLYTTNNLSLLIKFANPNGGICYTYSNTKAASSIIPFSETNTQEPVNAKRWIKLNF